MSHIHTPLMFNIAAMTQATGLPRTTVYGLIRKGTFDARKVGRRTLITAESVRAYLDTLPTAQIGNIKAAS